MDDNDLRLLARTIRDHRWAALATLGAQGPEASWVAYAFEADFSAFYLHLSGLASHTHNLLATPKAGLAISCVEQPDSDPQRLPRVALQGQVVFIHRDRPEYSQAASLYQARLPDSTPLFGFSDFMLFRFIPIQVRFVGGFARISTIGIATLAKAASL